MSNEYKDNILEIKEEFIFTVDKLKYVLENIGSLNPDHSTLHDTMGQINEMYHRYVQAKVMYMTRCGIIK